MANNKQQVGPLIGDMHIRWYPEDKKLYAKVLAGAKKNRRSLSEHVKFLVVAALTNSTYATEGPN